MAYISIERFPFLKQRKADFSPVYPKGILAILADYLYGLWRVTAKTHTNFLREIREDI